jgi:hypothetical protein
MQLPIKDNVVFKLTDLKSTQKETTATKKFLSNIKDSNAISDQNNPLISQVVFFAKMFENFIQSDIKKTPEEINQMVGVSNGNSTMPSTTDKDYTNPNTLKEIIYKTYSKSVDSCKDHQKKEKKKMKKIMNLIIYLQMKKVEMKINYFNDFEKLIQFESQQIKTMESQIIQDRIKLAIKKSELMSLQNKVKDVIKIQGADSNGFNNKDAVGDNNISLLEKIKHVKVENEPKIMSLN